MIRFSKTARPLFAIATVGMLVVGLTACGTSGGNGSTAATKSVKGDVIGFVPPVAIPAFTNMVAAMKTQATKYGMTVVSTSGGGFNVQAQIQAVNSLIARKVDVIVVPPLSPEALAPSVARAHAAGIKWIDYDSEIAGADVHIQSGETASAEVVATQLATAIKAAGRPCALGVISGSPAVASLAREKVGYLAGAKAAGCTILDQQTDTTNQATGGQTVGNAWKARFGTKMTGVLSYVGSVSLGVISTFGNRFQPMIGSEASDESYRPAIAQKKITVGFDSVTARIGQAAVYTADQVLSGKKVPATIQSPYRIVTSANVSSLPSGSTEINDVLGISITTRDGTSSFDFTYPKN